MVDIARVRRESLRWSLLVALNKTRPYTASGRCCWTCPAPSTRTPLRWSCAVSWIICPTARWLIWRKTSGDWFADLTRLGVDLVNIPWNAAPVSPARKSTGVNDGQTQHDRKAAGRRASLASGR